MSLERNHAYDTDEMHIERLEQSSSEEASAMATEREYLEEEMHVIVKEEVDDADSDGEECYIFADDMEIVELSGEFPYLRAALSVEDPNVDNSSNILLVDPSSKSHPFASAAGSSNGQSVKSNSKSPMYIDLRPSKKSYRSKAHKERLDFGEHFIFKTPGRENSGSVGNESNDYDSEIVIYPVQNDMQNIEGNGMYLENREAIPRKFVKNKGNSHAFQINNCGELLDIKDSSKITIRKSMQKSETHPFRCEECSESFELKSHFVMHELLHEKYKFYSFRTNTVKCICVQCKKPYLYSANDRELNSNMCIPCVVKLRERMVCNIDKGKENGLKRFLEFSDVGNAPKVKERKQCYSCGRRSDRYFVYGASLLCSQCWQDRTYKSKSNCRPVRPLPRGGYRRDSSTYTRYAEGFPFKSQGPNFHCEPAEENTNLIGTHFLLSAFEASGIDRVEDKDDASQELEEDWKETDPISAYEDESDSNAVILCDKTGEFINQNS